MDSMASFRERECIRKESIIVANSSDDEEDEEVDFPRNAPLT